jgi:hypothetical protein
MLPGIALPRPALGHHGSGRRVGRERSSLAACACSAVSRPVPFPTCSIAACRGNRCPGRDVSLEEHRDFRVGFRQGSRSSSNCIDSTSDSLCALIGVDDATPVTADYKERDNAFTGKILKVISSPPYQSAREAARNSSDEKRAASLIPRAGRERRP